MTKHARKSIVVLALWMLPVLLSPFTPTATAQASGWSFMSADLDADGLPNGVEGGSWCNAAGCFQTDPLDPDSDDDGLTDGQEKLFETDPLDDQSPGVYVEYEDQLRTRQYYARDQHSPASWGWQQHGDRFISTDAVVVRRGSSLSVGGPADADIQIEKSLEGLTTLTPVRDACSGRWRISLPSTGTVGKYQITLQDGGWSKSLNLYVIFELPTDMSDADVAAYVYSDDPDNFRDEYAAYYRVSYDEDHSWERWPPYHKALGFGWAFQTDHHQAYVFEEHILMRSMAILADGTLLTLWGVSWTGR